MALEKDINKALRRLLEIEDLEEINVTGNLDGGEGPISTPKAFAKSKDEDDLDDDHIEVFDYKRVKENKSLYNRMMRQLHLNEANVATVKSECIKKLSGFFRVAPQRLERFKFDGNDNIKELTKALNSTSDKGTELYYRSAIKASKRDLGLN